MFRKICGDAVSKNIVLVTNTRGETPREICEAREEEISSGLFKSILDDGGQMVRYSNTVQSAHDVIRKIMEKRPVVLQIQRELVDKWKDIINTTAGEAIDQELKEQIRRHRVELRGVQEEMVEASREGDEETRQELEEEMQRLQEMMADIARELEEIPANYALEKERVEDRMKEMEEGAKGKRDETDSMAGLVDTPVTIPADDLAHRNTSSSRAREAEWVDDSKHQFPPIPPRTPSPQMPSFVTSYVQICFRLATHNG